MRKSPISLLLVLLLAAAAVPGRAQTKVREKDLNPRFQDWLKLTAYIIQPAEREVFLSLTDDRERDIFIDAFWKQRDPTPATPKNEYQEEVLDRFKFANTNYHRGTPREGWMTDMGRIHMILGKPVSIERVEAAAGVYPCQVWYYYGDSAKGLPASFALVFVQRRGGEFKLYNPLSDGPGSLLEDTQGLDLTDHPKVYAKIRQLAPTLATVSVSLIPGQIPYGYVPSPRNAIILSTIFDLPKKDVNTAYATHFLNYKGVVSTEYLTNYIESSASLALIHDPVLDMDFLHLAVTPKTMSIDYYQPQDQYYCNFKLSVSLRQGRTIVFQYSKDYPFYFPPDRVEAIRANGVSVLDVFPIAEGTYGLTVLLQNAVGKEFSVVEKEVVVPPADGPVRLTTPILGYKIEDSAAAANVPFKVRNRKILTDPTGTISRNDDAAYLVGLTDVPAEVWREGALDILVAPSQTPESPVTSASLRLADLPYAKTTAVLGAVPARSLAPDYYQMTFTLKDGRGRALATATAPFVVSPAEAVPHPVTIVRTLPDANSFLYFFGLAFQYDRAGATDRAGELYAKGHALRPDYLEGAVDYADFLIRAGRYDASLELAESLKDNEKFRFDYFLLRGRALMGKSEFGPAIASLLEGNRIYDSDTRLLNALGNCYSATGKKRQALDAFSASLRLNPEQAEIKALVDKLEREVREPAASAPPRPPC